MEMEIQGRPIFGFKPTLTLLTALETCAILHYDSVCKATATQGGLIQREIQSLGFTGPESAWVTWTFRELDTALKVCENPPRALEPNSIAALVEFIMTAHKALQKSNELSVEWRCLVTPNEETA